MADAPLHRSNKHKQSACQPLKVMRRNIARAAAFTSQDVDFIA